MQQWIKIILSIRRCSVHFWIVSFSIRKTPWILYVWPFFCQLAIWPAHSHTLHDGDDGPLTIVDCFYSTTMMVDRFSFPLPF